MRTGRGGRFITTAMAKLPGDGGGPPRCAARLVAAGGSGPTFLCGGNQPTLADFCCFAELGQCKPEFGNLWDFSGLPATSAWMAAMEALPGFEASHKPLKKFAPVLQKMVAKFNAKLEAKL